jgi:hypothetical protein
MPIPSNLYRRIPGPVAGLTHDQFVTQLMVNDELHNIVFWKVADAFDLGTLTANDVPPFIVEYLESL